MRKILYNLLLFLLLFAIGLFFYRNLFDGQAGFLIAASLFPIPTWEVRLFTVFPCLVLMYLPIKEVYVTQYPLSHYKMQFR